MADDKKNPPASPQGGNEKNLIGAEFQALPLDFLISAPLIATVKAQHIAAQTTKSYIESMINSDGTPITVDFSVEQQSDEAGVNKIDVKAPLLSLVPVPHLRIDSLTVNFTFEVSQTYRNSKETDKSVDMTVSSGRALSPWVKASVKGSASSKATVESQTNRSGQLEITVNASEAKEPPEGLARVLSLMTSAIQTPAKS